MIKKPPEKRKKFFSFFYNFFHIFPLPLRKKKQNHLLFPPFLSLEIEKPQGKTSFKKKFFFFSLFSTLQLLVIGKITTYLFFRNSDLKCSKMPISAHKFHFLQITFFSAVITRTHTPTHTHSIFPTHYALKKTLNTCFLKIHFFSLYSFSLPPKHFLIFFSGKVATKKWSKNLPKGGKKFSFFL